MTLSLRFGAVSDIGRVRKKNDDSGYAGRYLIVVADGMGGAPAGDLASAVAIQTIRRLDVVPPADLLQALAGTILIANERLAELIEDDPSVEGMGTTITAVLFDGTQIGVAHLGDSRGFLWRAGELLRITRDHSWVQSLIDEGRISEQQAAVHSHRSLLLKVLDGRHDNDPDLSTYDVRAGDRILICSDGLTGFVPHERIERVMAIGTAQSVAAELTTLALESGSTDNVTVLVGDIVDGPPSESVEPLVVGAAGDSHRGPPTPDCAPGPGPTSRSSTRCSWSTRRSTRRSCATPLRDHATAALAAPGDPARHRRSALLCGGLAIAYRWSQQQYFVGADRGQVAIYQGVNANLPGVRLHHVYQDQHLPLSHLPGFRRSQVLDGLDANSLAKAQRIVSQLRGFAEICAGNTPPDSTSTGTLPLPPPPRSTTGPE